MSTNENTALKADVYRKVTDAIVHAIESGIGQYHMPWTVRQFSPISVGSLKVSAHQRTLEQTLFRSLGSPLNRSANSSGHPSRRTRSAATVLIGEISAVGRKHAAYPLCRRLLTRWQPTSRSVPGISNQAAFSED